MFAHLFPKIQRLNWNRFFWQVSTTFVTLAHTLHTMNKERYQKKKNVLNYLLRRKRGENLCSRDYWSVLLFLPSREICLFSSRRITTRQKGFSFFFPSIFPFYLVLVFFSFLFICSSLKRYITIKHVQSDHFENAKNFTSIKFYVSQRSSLFAFPNRLSH